MAQFRHQYVIGDLQGCYGDLLALLKRLDFDVRQDKVWFAGDIVARGDDSLGTLRFVKELCEQGAAEMVLGNHDINLLAVWRGAIKIKKKDRTQPIFDAPDCDKLLNWLRHQPVMLFPTADTVLVHAGIPPNWSIEAAHCRALELQTQLQSSLWQLDRLLPELYSSAVAGWSDSLTGYQRIRMICNYFTRMRLCQADGTLEFSFKSSLDDTMPTGFRPWFEWQVARERKILFGHWAALKARVDTDDVRATDAGCVWGGNLMAYRLEDEKVICHSCKPKQ
ncbi:symmetrical bis(5'-nucleosyl)-tetraphosphatase [Faucicola atlantae]|uniref:symmetrical bis(5'-nucleosyl)-tetraphosphatase n=1 Tax=Faucicola atlantae TaxID=34059 RepID=UPI0025AF8AEA|nr:symmetrical bis(5'-nucleosyl)-tetraphosphatase [Moraxella atlantae]